MKVDGKNLRPIWLDEDQKTVKIIDQRLLPHEFVIADLETVDDVITAIKQMYVRGAPLIGVTAAYGVFVAALNAPSSTAGADYLVKECQRLKAARPTAVNLAWAVDKMLPEMLNIGEVSERIDAARKMAAEIAEAEAENCRMIGRHGLPLIEDISRQKGGGTVNLLPS